MNEFEDGDANRYAGTTANDRSGMTMTGQEERGRAPARQLSANPDDPVVYPPPRGARGPLPGPRYAGAPGRVAIVQAQVFIVALVMVAQLWLITTALYELLSGHTGAILWYLALASGIAFGIVLIVAFWPLRRVRGL
jgi:hypothetical protein